jgi:small subunit ribosomal protein S6
MNRSGRARQHQPPFKNGKFGVQYTKINSIFIEPEPTFMAANVYEGLFIFDSDLYARGADEVSSQVAGIVEQLGGEVLLSRLWDERKLAYPIKGHRRGTYWLAYFRIDPSTIKDLTRQFQLSDSILRFLILLVEPRLVDTLVEHAKAGHLHARQTETPEEVPPISIIDAVVYSGEESN